MSCSEDIAYIGHGIFIRSLNESSFDVVFGVSASQLSQATSQSCCQTCVIARAPLAFAHGCATMPTSDLCDGGAMTKSPANSAARKAPLFQTHQVGRCLHVLKPCPAKPASPHTVLACQLIIFTVLILTVRCRRTALHFLSFLPEIPAQASLLTSHSGKAQTAVRALRSPTSAKTPANTPALGNTVQLTHHPRPR